MKELIVRFLKYLLGLFPKDKRLKGTVIRKKQVGMSPVLTKLPRSECYKECEEACGGYSSITGCGIHDCSCEAVWEDTGQVVYPDVCCCCYWICDTLAV